MANNFANDPNCVAVWRMESGALTTDSKGTNTLTDNNTVGTDTVNFKEGAACADFELNNSEYFSIADASLDDGFPLKTGDTNKKISVCFWIRPESVPGSDIDYYIWTKYLTSTNKRSFALELYYSPGESPRIWLGIGFNTGLSSEWKSHLSTISINTQYHVTGTYDNSDMTWAIRIRDASGNIVGSDATGIATLDANKIYIGNAPVVIGAKGDGSLFFDGLADEVVVFKDIITANEATKIAQGIYGLFPVPLLTKSQSTLLRR